MDEKTILQKTETKKDLKKKSVKPTGKVLKNSKELTKIVSVGICPDCKKEFIRPYECDIAVCKCKSVRLIPLEPAMIVDGKSYAKLSNLAKFANVSVERVLQVLLDTHIEKLEEKGLINLVKEVKE